MARRTVPPAQCFVRLPALLALILALACQVVAGGLLPAQAASATASERLAAATVLCRSGQLMPGQHAPGHPPAPHHHATDLALLRAAAAAGGVAAIAGPPPALPPPDIIRIGVARRGRARAPPAAPQAAAYPRGPPTLV